MNNITTRWVALSIGLIALVFGAWFMLNRQKPISIQALTQQALSPYPIGAEKAVLPEEAVSLYQIENYQAAEVILKENEASHDVVFFLANCFLQQQRPAESIPLLSRFLQTELKSHPLQQPAEYYLALAYLCNEEEDAGKALLAHITTIEGHTFLKEAKTLLEKISPQIN